MTYSYNPLTLTMVKLIPSILSDNLDDYVKFTNLYSTFSEVIHLDFMDGVYVSTKSPDVFEILESLKQFSVKKNLHLMLANPKSVLEKISEFEGIDTVYIHADVFDRELLNQSFNYKIGLILNPEMKVSDYRELILSVGTVMLMTVIPGKQGNEFLPTVLTKIDEIRAMNFIGEIHLDGHINQDTLGKCMSFQPDVLNIGSAMQKSTNPKEVYDSLKLLVDKY